jgi:dephospho-CoA kinase
VRLSVGLTGGIGSGKSAVSGLLAAHGAVVVDSDLLARESLAPGSDGLAAVVEEFGPGVLGPDGSLDRSRLAAVVFADGARRAALEAIVHPYVRRRAGELQAAAPEDAVVVHDVPLLVEKSLQDHYDVVVVVDVDEATQVERLAGRGMPEQEARARIAAQATRAQRLAVADEVLDNTHDLDSLTRQVAELWERLQARRAG